MTSRYSPVNHIRIDPFGVCTSMPTRRSPPTRTSIVAAGTVAPPGRTRRRSVADRSTTARRPRLGRRGFGRSPPRRSNRCGHPWCYPSLVASQVLEVVVHPVEAGLPHRPVLLRPGRNLFQGVGSRVHGRYCAWRPRTTNPACSSTLMCLEIAGSVNANGSASSLTLASPCARRARIARRVVFASAAKVSLSRSSSTTSAIGLVLSTAVN